VLSYIVQLSLSQRLLVALLSMLMVGFGMRAMLNLPIDAFPDISPTQVKVIIKSPGMTPAEVESLITQPIEVELLGIPRKTVLRSLSKYALSSITIDFEEGTDIYWARQQVAERLSAVRGNLPAGIDGGLAPMSTPLGDMFMFTVESDVLSLEQKRYLLDWTIRPALRTVPGVADVNALGGFVKTYQVSPQLGEMRALGVSNAALFDALASNNKNDGAGRISQGEESMLVRIEGAFATIADIEALQIPTQNGGKVRLDQVARVTIESLTRYGAVTSDGESEAVQGLVIGLRGVNARELITNINAKLEEINATLPEGTSTRVFHERSVLIEGAIGTVAKALLEAVALVVILLGLFLGSWRAALTVAVVLPMSALITFILMDLSSMSANLMSLGGLVIAIGMLVDSSIVIVENIVASLSLHANTKTATQSQGNGVARLPSLHIIYRAVKEVALPVTAGVAIIVIVFLPLLTLQGLEGKLFGPVTLTIVFALLGSLLVALTLVPVVASLTMVGESHRDPWLSRTLMKIYKPTLAWAIGNQKTVGVAALLLLLGTVLVFPRVGKTFMPTMDEGDIIIQLEMVPSINLATTVDIVQTVERAILEEVPDILRIVSRSGSDEIGMDPMGLNETDMFLQLKPPSQWQAASKEDLESELRAVLEQIPGLNYGFTQPIDMRVSEMLTGSRGDVAIKLFGNNLDELNAGAQRIAELVATVPGAVDTIASLNEGAQYLQIKVDRVRSGRFGIDSDELQAQLRAESEGFQVGVIREGSARVPLVVRYDSLVGDGLTALENRTIALPDGGTIALGQIASIERIEGPVSISRESGQRFAVVRTNVEGRDLVGFVEEAKAIVSGEAALPQGSVLEWGGEFENQQRASARLALVVPVALLLIAFILFLTFESLKQTVIVLSNIPFAMTGGLLALWLTGEFLSVPASVGFIALLGIAVLNGVVLMSHFNYLHAKGLGVIEIVTEGAQRRLRPVLMTATTCAFGLVPLLLATGPGSEIQKPLAIVVIGGLISSTVLTLYLFPLIYLRTTKALTTQP
jgi:cobalt-zinc-cadmium resistance protein CzcA